MSPENELKNTSLEGSAKIFKTLIDSLPFCVKWYDKEGKLVSINKFGKDEHYLSDKSDDEIRNTVFQSGVMEEYRHLVKEGMDAARLGFQKSCEIRHIHGTSKTDWVHNTFVPIKDENGEVELILMISREITEEKKLQEDRENNLKRAEETKQALFNILEDAKESGKILQRERDQSSAIISSMGECLVLINKEFKILLMNQKAGDILGVKPEEAVGLDYRELVHVLDKEKKDLGPSRPLENLFASRKPAVIDLQNDLYYLSSRNGYFFPVVGVATPLTGEENDKAVIVFQDVTKTKMLDEAKNSFISIASHQLRTPMTSIRWYIEMLSSPDTGPLNEEQKDYVDRAYKNVIKLGETINLLLTMARVESGKADGEQNEIELEKLVNDLVKSQEPSIKQKGITINVKAENALPILKMDSGMLSQVITNLISNSVRYTNQNGRIEISLSSNDREVTCSVKDDGIGVPDADKTRLFEKFFRAHNAISKVPDGSGLGLSLVRSLVDVWKGRLSFDSPTDWGGEKKGTKFTFTIPIKK